MFRPQARAPARRLALPFAIHEAGARDPTSLTERANDLLTCHTAAFFLPTAHLLTQLLQVISPRHQFIPQPSLSLSGLEWGAALSRNYNNIHVNKHTGPPADSLGHKAGQQSSELGRYTHCPYGL